MNKYYEMFINENIDESILKVNPNSLSFEDHFWHYACMSILYKNKKEFYLHKKCLSSACDLNYFYNAMLYFKAHDVLPLNFQKYVKDFEHKMKDDKLEDLILKANKKDKGEIGKDFLIYSLGSLLVIPIMLLLVFVFKLDTSAAAVISILALLLGQGLVSPFRKQRKEMKRMQREQTLTKEEKTFFDYKLIFYNLMNDPKLVALIKAEDDEEKNIIIDAIKKKKPIPEEILNKNNKKKRKDKKTKQS